jgi:cytosine/adenosine deaminase-related metal-dependent hydrolase
MALVLSGQVVPCDASDPDAVFAGRVFIDDGGNIEQVGKGNAAGPAGFAAAKVIDVGNDFIVPGLIDLHNHIGYNTLPLWAEPTRKTPYAHHDSWPSAPSYQSSITWPSKTLATTEPEALLAYVQLRALVGGTTAMQGWPTANRQHVQVLRNIDDETAGGTSHELIYTSTLTLKPIELAKKAQAQRNGAGFVYHCGEGQVASLVEREFVDCSHAGCLGRTFIGIHCNSLTANDWTLWPVADAGAVVWSPFSNLWLYGSTTDIKAARRQGVSVCIGSDWGPSGTKNIQGEIKVAKLVSQKQGLGLSDRDLVAMITSNPGDALARCWNKRVGRLMKGAFADITVIRAAGQKPVWTQIVESTEAAITLVIVGGVPRYGDPAPMQVVGGPTETFTLAGKDRRFAIADPAAPAKAWPFSKITGLLNAVIADPKAALNRAEARLRAFAGPANAAEAPLQLALDMPTGFGGFAGNIRDHADKVVIPPLASLLHDAKFFTDIKGRGFHGGLLDGLKGFYP